MIRLSWINSIAPFLAAISLFSYSAAAQENVPLVPDSKIISLETQLAEVKLAKSSARKKLAIRRVIREADALLEQNRAAPNRFQILAILFRGQQDLLGLDGSASNRAAFLETCRQLAAAPNEYAAVRLDADLLLSQTELARQGADLKARAKALRPMVERMDTEVEAKVVRIAMLMALEFGDTAVVNHLRQVIAQRFAGDLEMINFLRDKLAGQVFGAPFIGSFETADGKVVRLPMDYLGTTTAMYFWSKDNGGEEDLKELAAAWKQVKGEAAGRYQIVSFNLDNLPDAGQETLRELGLDWPALKLPDGRDSQIYQAYARRDPTIRTVSPTGYAAIYMSSGRRSRGYERNFQSYLARLWTHPRYSSQLQSVFAGEFLILDISGAFDPAAPPEWKSIAGADAESEGSLKRTAASVPEDKLRAIQACFIKPPLRYRTPFEQVHANYERADALCRQAIAEHPEAEDLWIVRNRRIIALLGLWKISCDRTHFESALSEAKIALAQGYPSGTDVVARFCLARQALRGAQADPETVISGFIQATGGEHGPGAALTAAAILSLDAGDRVLHEKYRRAVLDKHIDDPMLWTASSFMLDRYHRYWLYHPPFVAGWTYGRRQGYFLAWGQAEDAKRTLHAELKTLDGDTVRIPEDTAGKWTVISFVSSAQGSAMLRGTTQFAEARPFEDVNLMAAVLGDDADAVRAALEEKKTPDDYPTLLLPGGLQNPIVHQLGILAEDTRPNIVMLRPDGSIAVALSGLTMSSQTGNVIQHVLEWHDEKAVDAALASGDLGEAKRLAFAFAPLEEPTPPGEKKKPVKEISVPHLRSRAKVYMAMENWEAAFADIQETYLSVNSKAGYISMRTAELDEVEELKADILHAIEQANSGE
jgi:hypothetical protein